MNDLISIVVPVFNVENYLETCLSSICNQNYRNLQIIIVNDGSTDNSSKIIEKFRVSDSRITVINKKNGGLSDARNVGIEQAIGKYITFVDSDDSVEINYISTLYDLIKRNRADISICLLRKVFEGRTNKGHPSKTKQNEILVYSGQEAIAQMFYQKNISNSAFGKMYPTAFFEDISYPIGMLYEDLATTYKLFLKAKKIVLTENQLYNYLIRSGSIMRRKFDNHNMDRIVVSKRIVEDMQFEDVFLQRAAKYRLFISCVQVLREIPLDESFSEERKELESVISEFRIDILSDSNVRIISKIIALSTYFPLKVLQATGRIYKRISP